MATHLITGGLGEGPGPSSVFAFVSILATDKTITITTNDAFSINGQAADPDEYVVSALDDSRAVTVTAVDVSGPDLVLTTTPQTDGGSYSVLVPSHGIVSLSNDYFTGQSNDFNFAFTGVEVAPAIQATKAIDARTVKIIFDRAVLEADASDPANYSITNPDVTVYAATKVTDYYYILTTDKLLEDEDHDIAISGIREK